MTPNNQLERTRIQLPGLQFGCFAAGEPRAYCACRSTAC